MSAISDNLIHFLGRADKESPTKQYQVLRLILENGLRTGRVLIKFPDGSSVFNQIICFTDIPLRECNEHTSVYGKFGVGFKKAFVKRVGGNPARYFLDYVPGSQGHSGKVESRGALFLYLWKLYKFMEKIQTSLTSNPTFELRDANGTTYLSTEDLQTLFSQLLYIFSFDKEMGDLGEARDETKEIDLYYKEREWRLVPSKLNESAGTIRKDEAGDAYFYTFQRSDVNMIVVPNEELRLVVLEYFLSLRTSGDARLKKFGEDPPPIINYDDLNRW